MMTSQPKTNGASIIPVLRYRDAAKAIEWLCDTFGFQKHAVYPREDGTIMHAELSRGNGMIMVSTVDDSPFGKLMRQPDEIGQRETQTLCVVVEDADALYRKAKAAGAEIVFDIKDEDYGGRGFTCRDLEGHLWTLGTYDPWASK